MARRGQLGQGVGLLQGEGATGEGEAEGAGTVVRGATREEMCRIPPNSGSLELVKSLRSRKFPDPQNSRGGFSSLSVAEGVLVVLCSF